MRSLALSLLAAAACASARDPAPPAASRFVGVSSLALVRSVEDRTQRTKDPLDGLDETLRARGFTTRIVELRPGRGNELAAVQRLFEQLEGRAATRPERTAKPVAAADGAASELGVDAIATYHRLDRPRIDPPPARTFSPFPPPSSVRLTGALVLVDRAGHVATFAWGDAGGFDDPAVPMNAAEAIELLVRALTGEPPEE